MKSNTHLWDTTKFWILAHPTMISKTKLYLSNDEMLKEHLIINNTLECPENKEVKVMMLIEQTNNNKRNTSEWI